MKCTRDTSIEQFLLEEIQEKLFANKRDEVHASDLLSPKQAYWKRVMPMKATKQEIMYWLSGHAHESIFLYVSDFEHGKAKQWNGIWYTPDVCFNFPAELKTTRRGYVVKEGQELQMYEHYLKQLRFYCAMEDVGQGWLIVWYLTMIDPDNQRRSLPPDYFCYRVELEQEELEATRKEMKELHVNLNMALKTNDINGLPDCESWMCYKEHKHMISPPHCFDCKKDFKTDYGINSHIKGKKGNGHKVSFAKYVKANEPRCKYAAYCKPDMYNFYQEWIKKNQPCETDEE